MTQDEQDILLYFKSNPNLWVSMTEISRQVGGKFRFQTEPDWPRKIVKKFLGKSLLEMDASGAYRLKPRDKPAPRGPRLHVSPQVAEILKKSGKKFDADLGDEEADNEYERFLRERHGSKPGGQ